MAAIWLKDVMVLDAKGGDVILSYPNLANAPAGFYEAAGPLTDVAIGPGGLVVVGTGGAYGCFVTIDDRGVYRVTSGSSANKRVDAVAVVGSKVVTGGNEPHLRANHLLSDEVP